MIRLRIGIIANPCDCGIEPLASISHGAIIIIIIIIIAQNYISLGIEGAKYIVGKKLVNGYRTVMDRKEKNKINRGIKYFA